MPPFHRIAAAALALALGLVVSPGAARAEAAVTDGACSDPSGVTLVVDFQDLGGDTLVKCVTGLKQGASGKDVLTASGIKTQYLDGSFVCRIAGRPAITEELTVGGQPHQERCDDTPPKGAFWSYWHAENGGQWTFSQLGATDHKAIIGGFEGWSFALNRDASSNPPPGVRPKRAAPPSTAPAKTTPPASKPTAPATSAKATRTATSAATATKTPRSATPSPTPSVPVASSPPTLTVSPTPMPTPVETVEASSSPTPLPTLSAAPAVEADPPSGMPAGTLIGIGAVGAIAAAGGVVWWRRRGTL